MKSSFAGKRQKIKEKKHILQGFIPAWHEWGHIFINYNYLLNKKDIEDQLSDNTLIDLDNKYSLLYRLESGQVKLSENLLSNALLSKKAGVVDILLKSMIEKISEYKFNPEKLNTVLQIIEINLVKLIESNSIQLPHILDLLFLENKKQVIIESDDLPLTKFDLTGYFSLEDLRNLAYNSFSDRPNCDNIFNTKIYHSLLKLPSISGSYESYELIKALDACENLEIFRSRLIQYYLKSKWDSCFWLIFFQNMLGFMNLPLLMYLINYKNANDMYVVTLFLTINVFLLGIELLQMIVLTPIRYFGEIKIWYFGYVLGLAVTIAFALTGHENYALCSYLLISLIFQNLEFGSDYIKAYFIFAALISIPASLIWLDWDWIYLMHFIGILYLLLGFFFEGKWVFLLISNLIPANFVWIYGPHGVISIFWLIVYVQLGILANKIRAKSYFCILNSALLLSVTITSYFLAEEYFQVAYSIVLVFVFFVEYMLILQSSDLMVFLEICIFLFNLVILSAGVCTFPTLFWIFIIFQCVVVFIEIANRRKYLLDLFDTTLGLTLSWNSLDLARLVLSFYWVYLTLNNRTNNTIEIILLALTFIRGLTAFRCFNGTRYYVHLVISSIRDIKFFLVIFFYSTISFGVISSYSNGNTEFSFQNSLITAYDMNLGNFSHTENFSLGYFIFLCASIINVIIMLNLLISVLANSFENFRTIAAEIDFMEMADVLTEIEGLMICRRSNSVQKYFFVCDSDEKNVCEEGNVKIDEMGKEVIEGFESLDEKIENIEKSNSKTENAIGEMKASMDERIGNIEKSNTKMESAIGEMKASMDEKIGNIEKSNSKMESVIGEIKASMDSLLEILKRDTQY